MKYNGYKSVQTQLATRALDTVNTLLSHLPLSQTKYQRCLGTSHNFFKYLQKQFEDVQSSKSWSKNPSLNKSRCVKDEIKVNGHICKYKYFTCLLSPDVDLQGSLTLTLPRNLWNKKCPAMDVPIIYELLSVFKLFSRQRLRGM